MFLMGQPRTIGSFVSPFCGFDINSTALYFLPKPVVVDVDMFYL
jgi:hypothetical protein